MYFHLNAPKLIYSRPNKEIKKVLGVTPLDALHGRGLLVVPPPDKFLQATMVEVGTFKVGKNGRGPRKRCGTWAPHRVNPPLLPPS